MASKDDSFISLQGVARHFGSLRAVDDVSFDIRRGEFFSLLGPSGCGKTTLLRMLAGFEFPTQGEIFIDGEPMSAVPPNARPTNMVFQSYAIFPHLTVAQNIGYGLRKKGLSKTELADIVEQALQRIRLGGYGHRLAHQLSGGQRQRVALARALVCRPKVLLLDEPLGALDKKLREEMQIELRQLQRSVGITFVFVTHDQEEALALSDRIAVMSKGRTLQVDTAARLYEAPSCREVAGFIGSMNFFDGTVTNTDGNIATVDAGPAGTLRAPVNGHATGRGAEATVAVRPEKMEIAWHPPKDGVNSVAGLVAAEAYFGDRSHYHVEVAGLPHHIAVALQNSQRSLDTTEARGRQVWLTWPVDSSVLLPRTAD
jgi:spermidine/putrescine ABC transporter ATP-binding subunit